MAQIVILPEGQSQSDPASVWVLYSQVTLEYSSVDASMTAPLYTKPYSVFSYLGVVLDYL